mmetsp:Transcript_8926/g.31079  ORF Transcript_8926/g.31079 Transcript_8926/m.31079 type:complete len:211 (-) Transcript_8926:74-706(-)
MNCSGLGLSASTMSVTAFIATSGTPWHLHTCAIAAASISLTSAPFASIRSPSVSHMSRLLPVVTTPSFSPRAETSPGVAWAGYSPTPHTSKPGRETRRSWFLKAEATYTSPIAPPRLLKAPAVPAFTTMSGLRAVQMRCATSAAFTVPTQSTPNCASVPLATTVTLAPPTLPWKARAGYTPGKGSEASSFRPMASIMGLASASMAMCTTT